MLQESSLLELLLHTARKLIPKSVFRTLKPGYHWLLSATGALVYGFPSRSMKVIAVTGTKGKSTTVYMVTKMLEDAGKSVAMIGSLGYKINERTWPNRLKMTMPGRMKLHKFFAQAKKAGVEYMVLEVTSEGIAQHRLVGIQVDCAVMTNLRPEHLENHGSFQRYKEAKQQLFKKAGRIHILNAEDVYLQDFAQFKPQYLYTYGVHVGMINAEKYPLHLQLLGDFNQANALAALTIAEAYKLDIQKAIASLESIATIAGRMQRITAPSGTEIIVDYAHTPDSLEAVYTNMRKEADNRNGKMICVLGAAGGGRDTWKRPLFGALAQQYCDQIILTNEDPYDENPEKILDQIEKGYDASRSISNERIIDRKKAIHTAIYHAGERDVVVITGKGSEISMAISATKKIPWSDAAIVEEVIGE